MPQDSPRHSVRRTEAGWAWKFDPLVFLRFPPKTLHDYLAHVRCRVALLRGDAAPSGRAGLKLARAHELGQHMR